MNANFIVTSIILGILVALAQMTSCSMENNKSEQQTVKMMSEKGYSAAEIRCFLAAWNAIHSEACIQANRLGVISRTASEEGRKEVAEQIKIDSRR